MRPANRVPMPDLKRLLLELNHLLCSFGYPECYAIRPIAYQDTANPTVIAEAVNRRYVVKACYRFPDFVLRQVQFTDIIAKHTGLPIPRHLCAINDPGKLPLLVMDWMAGEPLNRVLPNLNRDLAATLAVDWGRCLARFHHAPFNILDNVDAPPLQMEGMGGWLHAQAQLQIQRRSEDGCFSREFITVIERFINERLPLTQSPAQPGFTKADNDIRDFLAKTLPTPRITAMVDWERITAGETLWEVTTLFIRLHLMNLTHLWPMFRRGYEEIAGYSLECNPHVELYLMTRALIAMGRQTQANTRQCAKDMICWLLDGMSDKHAIEPFANKG